MNSMLIRCTIIIALIILINQCVMAKCKPYVYYIHGTICNESNNPMEAVQIRIYYNNNESEAISSDGNCITKINGQFKCKYLYHPSGASPSLTAVNGEKRLVDDCSRILRTVEINIIKEGYYMQRKNKIIENYENSNVSVDKIILDPIKEEDCEIMKLLEK